MKTVKGDLIALAQQGEFDVIVHGCNCFCNMGAGIAKQIAVTFPEALKIDLTTKKGDISKLGTVSVAIIVNARALYIVNAYTQYRYGYGRGEMHCDYDAIKKCFKRIKLMFTGQRIGYPAIGAGLARGDWSRISAIINEELEGEDHTFVEYLPIPL